MFMDVASFLKMVPAAIGIAGLLTYFTRSRKPVSDLELVNYVQNLRNTFVLLGCGALIMLSVWLIYRPAPPDRDAALSNKVHQLVSRSFEGQSAALGERLHRPEPIALTGPELSRSRFTAA
jgi:hypothetical protein